MVIIDNFTKVKNDVFLVMYYLSGAEVKIFFWIYRKTVGYDKKTDGISISQFSENLGISKMQVNRAIKSLKEKKLIKVKPQKNKNGAKYFNRYEINFNTVDTLVTKCDKGSNKMLQGVVTKCDKGSNKMLHTKDNNTKNNITKEERENILADNVYFSLSERDSNKFLNEFIDHLIEESDYIRSETAFKIKIRKLFAKEDLEQLEEFERWYLEEECNRLNEKYQGREVLLYGVDRTYIKSIYPYFDTEKYDKEDKLYIWLKFKETDETYKTLNFINSEEAEDFLKGNCGTKE